MENLVKPLPVHYGFREFDGHSDSLSGWVPGSDKAGYEAALQNYYEAANDQHRSSMTDAELLVKVRAWNSKLCKTGGAAWALRVPADLDNDPDMLIEELCKRLEEATRELCICESALQDILNWTDEIERNWVDEKNRARGAYVDLDQIRRHRSAPLPAHCGAKEFESHSGSLLGMVPGYEEALKSYNESLKTFRVQFGAAKGPGHKITTIQELVELAAGLDETALAYLARDTAHFVKHSALMLHAAKAEAKDVQASFIWFNDYAKSDV